MPPPVYLSVGNLGNLQTAVNMTKRIMAVNLCRYTYPSSAFHEHAAGV